jgi:hypothetical protein
VIGFAIAKGWDNYPKAVPKIREEFEIRFRNQTDDIASEELKKFDAGNMEGLKLLDRLNSIHRRALIIDPDGWHDRAADHLDSLRAVHFEYEKIRSGYVEVVEEVVSKVSAYFSDATRNLAHLNAAAGRIKKKAIEPSFELLAETRRSLSDVKRRLQAIEFL